MSAARGAGSNRCLERPLSGGRGLRSIRAGRVEDKSKKIQGVKFALRHSSHSNKCLAEDVIPLTTLEKSLEQNTFLERNIIP